MKQLFLSILLMLLPGVAWADPVEIGGIWYNLIPKGNAAEVSQNPNGYSGDIVIPETINYGGKDYNVTSILGGAFLNCKSLTSLTIPKSINKIGTYAIGSMDNSFPPYNIYINDLETWCNISKGESSNLYAIISPYKLFLNGLELEELVIPNTIKSIQNYSFIGCLSIKSVVLHNDVESIGELAFAGCTNMNSVDLANVKDIQDGAFYNTGLSSVTIPNSVTSVKGFSYCRSLISVTILNGVTGIGDRAFEGCSSMTSVIIPESVTGIGNYAFRDCSSLNSVTILESVTSIGNYAFSGCSSLTSITIPKSVTGLYDYAFSGCSGLTSVSFPNSMLYIGPHAFSDCTGMTSVTIPCSMNYIDYYAFSGCTNLENVYSYQIAGSYYDGHLFAEHNTFDDSYPKIRN